MKSHPHARAVQRSPGVRCGLPQDGSTVIGEVAGAVDRDGTTRRSAMPSSQTFVSIVQATLGSAATERMSALYLPQYAAAMVTVTLATGVGMALV